MLLLLLGVQRVVSLLAPGLFLIVIYYAAVIGTGWQMKKLGERLNYAVRETSELAAVRRLIDLNMKVAYLMMIAIWPLIIAAVLTGTLFLTAALMPGLLLSPLLLGIEKRFKAMNVDADPAIAAQFAEYLAQWKEPKFGLSR